MTIKTPTQLENEAITDAINTVVGLELREQRRQMVNNLRTIVAPQVDRARLEGRRVDVRALVQRLWKEQVVANSTHE